LEKIDLGEADTPENWTVSDSLDGTPGRANSRRRLARDIALASAVATPDTIHPPSETTIRVEVANVGSEEISAFSILLTWDGDLDSAVSGGDRTVASWSGGALAPRQRTTIECPLNIPVSLPHPLIVSVRAAGDENESNNTGSLRLAVGLPAGSIVINEIMALPSPGEGQWLELLNNSSEPLPLVGCRIKTGTSSAGFGASFTLPVGDYIVLAENPASVRERYGMVAPVITVEGAFPHLSATSSASRRVSLCDRTGRAVDEAAYPVPESGRSLEKENPSGGPDLTVWVPAWGPVAATPGLRNMAAQPLSPDFECIVSPIPATDTVGISIRTPYHGSFVVIKVYDLAGREIRRLLDGERYPASIQACWDGKDAGGRPVPTGAYILQVEIVPTEGGRSFTRAQAVVIARRR
jgi:hypothetical protein